MKEFKSGYYQADTTSGVIFYDYAMDNPDVDIMSPRDFYDSLRSLEYGKTIYAGFDIEDQGVWEEINKEYGIRGRE